ncbi:glycosyltransferase [Neorhizobium alkalisoli]|uniref:glycosyltransferase n=1 Tax=Neorhizobium alkalisoli TaxID=528178 RepID=UPI000CFA6B31|nr:glycosyltransferase [Neorhizobium alkalisoli]
MRMILSAVVWALASALIIILVTLPINTRTQLITSLLVVGVMMVIRALKAEGQWRLVALAFGTAMVFRYVYWRTTSTLPPVNQLENFIPGLLVYLAEMYSVLMLALSLFVVSMPLPPRPPYERRGRELPTVDVFVPTYNEDEELLANTLAAARNMDYPPDKFTVWLLDDGGTLQKRTSGKVAEAHAAETRYRVLQQLCDELGVRYLTRERNEHAKAGNLNNGLQHSTGALIAVFDADHAPARDFLLETVGYFDEDPKLFLVQTPHFFLNPDPIERNLRTFEKMPSENEMFYGVIQRGLDKWNAAFFASFIGQRSRWAQGMMQILRFRFPPLKRGLSIPQRLCYMSSTLFWLFPFPRTIFLFAPLFYLFFDLQIFTSSGSEFMVYSLAYIVVNLMMQNYLYGSYRWPWISELYEYVQTVHLLPAVVSVILNPRKPTFKVTAKDESVSASRLSEISRPFFVIFFVLLVAFGVSVYRIYTEPYKADVTLVVGAWNVLNIIFAGCALGVVSERGERQASRRVKVSRRCELGVDGRWFTATIEDVSAQGSALQIYAEGFKDFAVGKAGTLRFQPYSDMPVSELPVEIRHFNTVGDVTSVGCRYMPQKSTDHRLIADLIFANSTQWTQFQISRRRNPGLIMGSLWFLGLAAYQTVRGLSYLFRNTANDMAASARK